MPSGRAVSKHSTKITSKSLTTSPCRTTATKIRRCVLVLSTEQPHYPEAQVFCVCFHFVSTYITSAILSYLSEYHLRGLTFSRYMFSQARFPATHNNILKRRIDAHFQENLRIPRLWTKNKHASIKQHLVTLQRNIPFR